MSSNHQGRGASNPSVACQEIDIPAFTSLSVNQEKRGRVERPGPSRLYRNRMPSATHQTCQDSSRHLFYWAPFVLVGNWKQPHPKRPCLSSSKIPSEAFCRFIGSDSRSSRPRAGHMLWRYGVANGYTNGQLHCFQVRISLACYSEGVTEQSPDQMRRLGMRAKC